MLTCNDANALIVRTLDDALSSAERTALRRHLASCERCRAEYETQHEVKRLLVLHMPDPLPEGFDQRLNARLARTSRSLPSGVVHGAPAPVAAPRFQEADDERWRGTRGRMWALRLIPLAATFALIVAGTLVRDRSPQPVAPAMSAAPAVSSDASSRALPGTHSGAAAPGQPRAFTTITLPHSGETSRRHRSPRGSREAAEDLALAPAQPPLVEDSERRAVGPVAESTAVSEHASRPAKVAQSAVDGTSGASERVTASEPRRQERARVARREGSTSGQSVNGEPADHERVDSERAGGERAASQQPGILPRPAAPTPHARPAMPAPSAVLPDRTIPPP
jgi:anti-sigma factor RsiW